MTENREQVTHAIEAALTRQARTDAKKIKVEVQGANLTDRRWLSS